MRYFVLEMLVRGEAEVVVAVLLLLGFAMLLRVKGRMVVWDIGGGRRPGRPSALVLKRMNPFGLLGLGVLSSFRNKLSNGWRTLG